MKLFLALVVFTGSINAFAAEPQYRCSGSSLTGGTNEIAFEKVVINIGNPFTFIPNQKPIATLPHAGAYIHIIDLNSAAIPHYKNYVQIQLYYVNDSAQFYDATVPKFSVATIGRTDAPTIASSYQGGDLFTGSYLSVQCDKI